MTASKCLCVIVIGLLFLAGEGPAGAEDDVTIVTAPATTPPTPPKTVAPDGTPIVHKSSHKKKTAVASGASTPTSTPVISTTGTASPTGAAPSAKTAVIASGSAAKTTTASASTAGSSAVGKPVVKQSVTPAVGLAATPSPTATVKAPATYVPPANYSLPPSRGSLGIAGSGPAVETGLPVARPGSATVVYPKPIPGSSTIFASVISPGLGLPSSLVGGHSGSSAHVSSPSDDFVFTNFSKKPKNTYPWKTGIITTEFWIGEGGTAISSTDNVASAWDENWRSTNRGSDDPSNRNGYASADHASTVNPFYVALPFNDLAFPDKAHRWLPSGWYRRPKDGKQVSACQHRWVWIKNAQGRSCFAQWEDVGPLRYDHAEYVFGPERPIGLGDNHAGLDVSPAVAQYLGIDGKNRYTAWRFVDDEDVPPGQWLKYDEQAVIFTALHQMKSNPIRSADPSDDPSNDDSNKKKVDQSKG